MADASDSKSDVGDYVWVQVPSPASQIFVIPPKIRCFRRGYFFEKVN